MFNFLLCDRTGTTVNGSNYKFDGSSGTLVLNAGSVNPLPTPPSVAAPTDRPLVLAVARYLFVLSVLSAPSALSSRSIPSVLLAPLVPSFLSVPKSFASSIVPFKPEVVGHSLS